MHSSVQSGDFWDFWKFCGGRESGGLSGNRGEIGVLPWKTRDVYGMASMVVPCGSGAGRIGGWGGCGSVWRVARGVKPRGVARNRPRLRGGEVSPGRGPGARFARFLSDFASPRLMTRIEFGQRVCGPRFHHVADATRSPDGRHMRASPMANVPRIARPGDLLFPRASGHRTGHLSAQRATSFAKPSPRLRRGGALWVWSSGLLLLFLYMCFIFCGAARILGCGRGGRGLEIAGAIFRGKNCDPHGGFKKMKNWLSHSARRLR